MSTRQMHMVGKQALYSSQAPLGKRVVRLRIGSHRRVAEVTRPVSTRRVCACLSPSLTSFSQNLPPCRSLRIT